MNLQRVWDVQLVSEQARTFGLGYVEDSNVHSLFKNLTRRRRRRNLISFRYEVYFRIT